MMHDWFSDAKLGIFLHWGIYSVDGIPESWSFFNGQVSYDDYMAQRSGFTAARYNPDEWASLFKRAGARYAVLTAKHHDGVALWDTAASDLNVVDGTPAGRDLIGPYCDSLRREGLHVGLYFSHLDWAHPDYASLPTGNPNPNPFTFRGTPDPDAWERFLTFHRAQLRELCTRYRPELLWFDGDWERSGEEWRMAELREQLHAWGNNPILNSRMKGHGDYETPEQGLPVAAPKGPWEFCMTVNNSWGYQKQDHDHKSTRQIVRYFCECISMGGNLLLDIGPYEDGSLQPEQVRRLEELGDWIAPRAEAIYGTGAGLPAGYFLGGSTLAKDRRTLYLFVYDRPWDRIAVKGIRNGVSRITALGTGTELPFRKVGGAPWANIPGVLWIDVPEAVLNANATVLKVELDGELDLYGGAGGAIQQN